MILDYDTLRLLHWGILFACLLGFVIFEGTSLGGCLLLPLLDKQIDQQKILRILVPQGLTQQAWLPVLITLLFAAWPIAFAVLFSSLQWLLVFSLLAWLYRAMIWLYIDNNTSLLNLPKISRNLAISSYLLVTLLGVIAGNVLKGIPFHLDSDMRIIALGDLSGLFNPFSFFIAIASLALLTCYAACYLFSKTDGQIDIKPLIVKSGGLFLVFFAAAGLWLLHLEGYHINSEIISNADSNPLNKFVKRNEGLWLDNYEHQPFLWGIPALGFLSGFTIYLCLKHNRHYLAFISSSMMLISATLAIAISLFPFLIPSNRSLNSSLTLWDASASFNTLLILFWLVISILPIMILLSGFFHKSQLTDVIDNNTP